MGKYIIDIKHLNYIIDIDKIYIKHTLMNLGYHNSCHIKRMIKDFINTKYIDMIYSCNVGPFILAIIYHDSVYDPKYTDNEKRSVDKFFREVKSKDYLIGFTDPELYDEYIPSLIMSTKYGEIHDTPDKKILHDLDYAGFSDSSDVYKSRSHEIWKEYSRCTSYEIYREKRIEFLESLLKRENIYYYYHTYDNEIALKNIKNEINHLKKSI